MSEEKVVKTSGGVYLILWDESNKNDSIILKPTKTGWPHITLANTRRFLDTEQLIKISGLALSEWMNKTITITKSYVNSFKDYSGNERHDVLLCIAETEAIEKTRERLFKIPFDNHTEFNMGDPHITHKICTTLKEAEEIVAQINTTIVPFVATVRGVTLK